MSVASIQQMIVEAAARYGVPANIALGVAAHESNFDPNAKNYNANGTTDWGVMQLNDSTVQTLGVQNPLDPAQNIDAGVSLLGTYLRQYGGNTAAALQAYASGPGSLNSPPNSIAQGFINFVTSYGGGAPAQPSGIDYAQAATETPAVSIFSGIDLTDPVTVFGLAAAALGLTWIVSRV